MWVKNGSRIERKTTISNTAMPMNVHRIVARSLLNPSMSPVAVFPATAFWAVKPNPKSSRIPYPNNDHNKAQNPNWAGENCWNIVRNKTRPSTMRTTTPIYPLVAVLQNLRCHSSISNDFLISSHYSKGLPINPHRLGRMRGPSEAGRPLPPFILTPPAFALVHRREACHGRRDGSLVEPVKKNPRRPGHLRQAGGIRTGNTRPARLR